VSSVIREKTPVPMAKPAATMASHRATTVSGRRMIRVLTASSSVRLPTMFRRRARPDIAAASGLRDHPIG
jgi:hypothetical protein